jgi:hypothetical protein
VKCFLCGLLSGSVLISGAVIWTRGTLAGMFILGMCVSLFSLVSVCRVIGFGRVARLFSLLDHVFVVGAPLSGRKQRDTLPRSRAGQKTGNGLRSSTVLPTVQQEVLSALVNLGMKFREAEKAVSEAAQGRKGQSFDELFRACLPDPKLRKAA